METLQSDEKFKQATRDFMKNIMQVIARKETKMTKTDNRKNFRKEYSNATVNIVRDIARGWDTTHIATANNTTNASVAAVRANLTRGAYAPFARMKGSKVTGTSF